MTVRDDARQAHERFFQLVLEMDIDRCQNVYGVLPCTAVGAVGSECYNCYESCQDKANYVKGIYTRSLTTRGGTIPPGELIRPYIKSFGGAATVADIEKGLARRAFFKVVCADEVCSDVDEDPYYKTRATPAGGTWWKRFLVRNPNYTRRFARVRKIYKVDPWDWNTAQDELFIIEEINGPNASGEVTITLQDPIKRAENIKVPIFTAGKLINQLNNYEDQGAAQGGTANTIILRTEASAVDDTYIGMAIPITEQTGAGQERICTAYNGATREATVSPNWLVPPDSSSIYNVQELKITLTAGTSAEYAVYGVPGYLRIGDETIKFTDITNDVISWPDTSYRTQFNTPIKTHKVGARAQVVKYFDDQAYTDVVKWLYNAAGISDTYIDTAGFATEDKVWLGYHYRITVPLVTPEQVDNLIKDLVKFGPGMTWWSPIAQQVKFKYIGPNPPGGLSTVWSDEATFNGQQKVITLNDLRLTQASVAFDLDTATSNLKEAKNYLDGDTYIDSNAEGPNEHNESRQEVNYCRWFNSNNARAVQAYVNRKVTNRRNAPKQLIADIDPKDFDFDVGDSRDVESDKVIGLDGQRLRTQFLIIKVDDKGKHIAIEARNIPFASRVAFWAPNATPDYPANDGYACWSLITGLMPNGESGFLWY